MNSECYVTIVKWHSARIYCQSTFYSTKSIWHGFSPLSTRSFGWLIMFYSCFSDVSARSLLLLMQKHLNPFECSQFDDAGIQKKNRNIEWKREKRKKRENWPKPKVKSRSFEEEIKRNTKSMHPISLESWISIVIVLCCLLFNVSRYIQFSREESTRWLLWPGQLLLLLLFNIQFKKIPRFVVRHLNFRLDYLIDMCLADGDEINCKL